MNDDSFLEALMEMEPDEEEMTPEIVPLDAKLSFQGDSETLKTLFRHAAKLAPLKDTIPGTMYAKMETSFATSKALPHLTIQSTDGEQTLIEATDKVTISISGNCLVPAKRLYDILVLCRTEQVRISVTGNVIEVHSGRAVWRVQAPVESYFAAFPAPNAVVLHPTPAVAFREALRWARTASGHISGRPSLAQVLIRNGEVTACDGSRLHRVIVDGLSKDLNVAIPNVVADQLLDTLRGYPDDNFGFGNDAHTLFFEVGNSTVAAHRLTLEYPNVETLLNLPAFSNSEILEVDSEELSEAILHVRVNSDPDQSNISLDILSGDQLAVSSKDKAGNTAQEVIPCTWSGKSRSMVFNHHYLRDLISPLRGAKTTFKLGTDTKTQKSALYVQDLAVGIIGTLQQAKQLM